MPGSARAGAGEAAERRRGGRGTSRPAPFVPAGADQGELFDEREAGRRAALYRAFDGIRSDFGHGVLVSGRALHLKGRLDEDEHGFILRTPSLTK